MQETFATFGTLFDQVQGAIQRSSVVALAVHEKPDGDALGSMLALAEMIREMPRKHIITYSCDPVPSSLSFLPNVSTICSFFSWYPDLIIGLDYGNVLRLGIPAEYSDGAQMITFDHHPPDAQQGDVCIIDTVSSSTAELVYLFMQHNRIDITPNIALCLLTGIFTDSGGFLHTNTTQRTLKIVGELLQKGVSLDTVRFHTFSSKPPKMLNCWGEILSQLQCTDYGMAYIGISYKKFQEYNVGLDDLSGIISMINAVGNIRFCAFLVEYEQGKVKGSLRSEPFKGVDVSVIAKRLGGGGHKYAAGFEMKEGLKSVERKLKKEAKCVLI